MDRNSMRLMEFLEDNDGARSLVRLMFFASFFPATYLACAIKTTEALSVYLATYGLAYGNSKWAERKKSNVIPIKKPSNKE